jgi:hypothetical protein
MRGGEIMGDTLTVKDIAGVLEVEPKTLRKFLRSEVVENGGTVGVDTPGKGKRYSFEEEEVVAIVERFHAWADAKTPTEEEVEDELEDEFEDDDTEDPH